MYPFKKFAKHRRPVIGALLAFTLFAAIVATASPASAATGPTTSPAVSTFDVGFADASYCNSGYFCAFVPDPNNPGLEKVFPFYNCGTYTLYNWQGGGFVVNHQTGGTVANIYNSAGGVVHSYAATDTLVSVSGGWTPIYYIRAC